MTHLCCIILSLLFVFSVHADKEFISLGCREGAGMFSIFQDVLSLVKYYDKECYNGIEVDFEEGGLYYDANHGSNWWSYYCEPIFFGTKENVRKVAGDVPFQEPFEIELHTDRETANTLINKYIHLKPWIKQKIEAFKSAHFKNAFVIGVHYRGTDKAVEAPLVDYHFIAQEIKHVMNSNGRRNYKIFIATDEHLFIHYLSSKYKNFICYNKEALRSSDRVTPVHLGCSDPYKCGEDAIIDAYLLGECNVLIRTSSNLSRWSTFLNPDMPVIQLN